MIEQWILNVEKRRYKTLRFHVRYKQTVLGKVLHIKMMYYWPVCSLIAVTEIANGRSPLLSEPLYGTRPQSYSEYPYLVIIPYPTSPLPVRYPSQQQQHSTQYLHYSLAQISLFKQLSIISLKILMTLTWIRSSR